MARAGGGKGCRVRAPRKQLVADLNAERERTRALQDRVIDMERHTAQTTAELDVVKRENTSLQGSLARAREEFSVRQFAPPSKPPVQHHHQQMDQTLARPSLCHLMHRPHPF